MDSDDDNLPSSFIECNSPEKLFKVDHVVWAKYGKFFWPAVIKNINPRKKKIGVIYFDSPNSRAIQISSHRAISFNSKKGRALKKQKIKPSDAAELFEKSLKCVEDYLCKRCLTGKRLSLDNYFSGTLVTNEDTTQGLETPENSQILSVEDKSTELEESHLLCNKSEDFTQIDTEIRSDFEIIDNSLLKLISSNPCTDYLRKILEGKLKCDRHRKFFSSTASVRRQLKLETGFGRLHNRKEFPGIIESLHAVLNELASNKTFDFRSYLFDVWIPEAITWALAKYNKISLTRAKELYSETYNNNHKNKIQ